MSNAKGSDNKKVVATPSKVVASSRSEAKSVSAQNLRQTVQKAVAMPASAVRAAVASARTGAGAVRVAYDVISRLLTLLESGIVIDKATLQTTKGAIDAVGITDDVAVFTIGKAYNDVCTLNDVLIRVINYNRTYSEVLELQEQTSKTLHKSPLSGVSVFYGNIYTSIDVAIESILNSNPSLSYDEAEQIALGYLSPVRTDFANPTDARLITVGKNFSEAIELPETFTKVVSFVRNPAEVVQTADVRTFAITKPKADVALAVEVQAKELGKPLSDTFGLSDNDILAFNKAVNDIMSGNDARTLLFTKKIEDFILATDAFLGESGVLAFSNSEVNLAAIADQLERVVSFVRFFPDTASTSETMARVISKPKADRLTVGQKLTRVVDFNRTFSDTSSASETFFRTANFIRAYNETFTSTDAPAKTLSKAPFVDTYKASDAQAKSFAKPFANGGDVFDSFSKTVQYNRNFNSNANAIAMADIISTIKQFNRGFNEIPRATDTFTKDVYFRRFFADTNAAADSFSKTVTFVRSFGDTQEATDALTRVVQFNRTFSDASTAADLVSRTVSKIAGDTGSASDSRSKHITKAFSDILRIGDSLYFSSIIHPEAFPPADTQAVTDSFRKLVTFVRSKADVATAAQTDTIQYTKVAGQNVANIWSDFNDLGVYVELCQYYPDYRVEYLRLNETVGKSLSKRVGPFTYYTDATWTDFAELSVGLDTDQEIAQEFWRQAYSSDHDLVTFAESFSRTVSYVRSFADTSVSVDTTGRYLARNVGDARSRVFNDFADLFYTQEKYTNIAGYGAVVNLTLAYTGSTVSVVSGGTGYTVGKQFNINLPANRRVVLQVTGVSSGAITTMSIVSITPALNRSVRLTDYLDFMYSVLDDPESSNNYTVSFADDNTYNVLVGPETQSRHNVVGQDLLFTLTDRVDGDKVSYTDSAARTFNKVAVDPYPQGFWSDYNELSFGSYVNDQELTQRFQKFKPTAIQVVGAVSLATLGLTKKNSLVANLLEVKTMRIGKPVVDTAATAETLVKVINKTAGDIQVNTWTDLQEFIFSGIMGIEYGTRYDAIYVPDQPAKSFTKTLYFDSYVWRDYNELSFATAADTYSTFSWGVREYTDIVRVAENTIKTLGKSYTEQANILEGIGKEMSINGGDGRNRSYFRDWLGLFPIGEAGAAGNPILDEELTLKFTPGSKTDFAVPTDSAPKTITKAPVIRVAPYWSDFAELSFGTTYDQELLQYQETTRPETIKTADLFRKIWTANRTFNDTVTITDSALLSINGGPLFTLLYGTNDIARGSETLARYIGLAAGDVSSYYSTWQDYAELTLALELAQYYYRGTDSTVDIGKIVDQKANLFTKKAGRTQNIMDFAFNEELFYDRDLLQTFAQDYVTEIIRPVEVITLNYGKNPNEPLRITEEMPRVINKPMVGDSTVPVSRNIWNPLYISGVSNYEEDIRFGNYTDARLDIVFTPDVRTNVTTKQLGFGPVNTWNDYRETARSVYDLTLLTYGFYGATNNSFAQTIFNRYLDEFIDEEHLEMLGSSYRTEIIAAADYFFRAVTYNRSYAEALTASSQPSIQFSPGTKQDTAGVTQTNVMEFGKAAGERFQVWRDYVELHPFNELAQNFPDFKTEWLNAADSAKKKPTKGLNDPARASDSVLFVKGKNPSDLPVAADAPQKGYTKLLGDQSDFAWVDYNEILSFNPTQMTFGSFSEFKRDKTFAADAKRFTYTKRAGKYRAHIWSDYLEIDTLNPFTDLTQAYPDYVTELILPVDDVAININKGLRETPRASDSGAARLYPPNGYALNAPIVYFADDYEESVETSTF